MNRAVRQAPAFLFALASGFILFLMPAHALQDLREEALVSTLANIEASDSLTADDAILLFRAMMVGPKLFGNDQRMMKKLTQNQDDAVDISHAGRTYHIPPRTSPAVDLILFVTGRRDPDTLWLKGPAEMHTYLHYARINDVSDSSFQNNLNAFFYYDWLELEEEGDTEPFRETVARYLEQVTSPDEDGFRLSARDLSSALTSARDSLAYVDSIRGDRMPDELYESIAVPAE